MKDLCCVFEVFICCWSTEGMGWVTFHLLHGDKSVPAIPAQSPEDQGTQAFMGVSSLLKAWWLLF